MTDTTLESGDTNMKETWDEKLDKLCKIICITYGRIRT